MARELGVERFGRASTTEQVMHALREAIVEGRIAQGEPLREAALADALGTGRGAVREAVRQLIQEGLVSYTVHRGASVRVISPADRLDVYVAREAIETQAARLALEAGDPPDLGPLKTALARLRTAAGGQAEDGPVKLTRRLVAADVRFHQELVRLARSERLDRIYETLAAEARMLLIYQPPYPRSDYVDDHERLLTALADRDPATPDLVAEHLRLSAHLIAGELAGRAEEETTGRPAPDHAEGELVR
jgi:DNA-binding GntR family transcriptional regulator